MHKLNRPRLRNQTSLRPPDGVPWRGLLLAASALFLAGPRLGAALDSGAAVPREYQIKAAFLYNFTKFVEWPAGRFASPDSPIVIGILLDNPFGDALEAIVKNRKVNNRPIDVRIVTTAAEATAAHILFAGAGQDTRMAAMIDTLRKGSVLTVGESPAFAAYGGVIDFVVEGDKVRFAINRESGQRAGLKISAQLLKLAAAASP